MEIFSFSEGMNRVSLLLEKKEELVFQHNRKQAHKEVPLWRRVNGSFNGQVWWRRWGIRKFSYRLNIISVALTEQQTLLSRKQET